MSWEQFSEWQEYYTLEPFGEERDDLRAGTIASVIANVNRDPRRGVAFKPSDFMPKFGTTAEESGTGARAPLTDQSQWSRVKEMAKMFARGR